MVEPVHAWPGGVYEEEQAATLASLLQRSFNQSDAKIAPEDILSAARHAIQSGQVDIISRQAAIEAKRAPAKIPGMDTPRQSSRNLLDRIFVF